MTMKRNTTLAGALAALLLFSGCSPYAAENAPKPQETATPVSVTQMAGKAEAAHQLALSLRTELPAPETVKPFTFTPENFPVLSGSAAAIPTARAAASELLSENAEAAVISSDLTDRSYRKLMAGEANVILAAEPSCAVWDEKEAAGFDWEMSPVAVDALVFVVNADNPVENLTREQARDIFSGRLANWSALGGPDLTITVLQRTEEAGSRTALLNLVMDGEAVTENAVVLEDAEGLLTTAAYNVGATAYTSWYYMENLSRTEGVKLLKIDGVTPCAETIRSGAYPLLNHYYVLTAAGHGSDDPAKALYDWFLSPEGRQTETAAGWLTFPEEGSKS